MSKRVYISADYSVEDGDRNVVDELHKWSCDNLHSVDYVDTAEVVSGSVSDNSDCRSCDLKQEFNKQINASSAVIFIIGDKTSSRTAGSTCRRLNDGPFCSCTPYKQNANGLSYCKIFSLPTTYYDDINPVNNYSFLRHEFEQAKQKRKKIIIVYNSLYKQTDWLPWYLNEFINEAQPFWVYDGLYRRVGNYSYIKSALGY